MPSSMMEVFSNESEPSMPRFFFAGEFGLLADSPTELLLLLLLLLIFEPPPTGTINDALLFLFSLVPLLLLLPKATKAPSTPPRTQFKSLRRYSRCFSSTMVDTAWMLFLRDC